GVHRRELAQSAASAGCATRRFLHGLGTAVLEGGPLAELAVFAQRALGAGWTREKTWLLWRWIRPTGEVIDEQDLYRQGRCAIWRLWEATTAGISVLR